MIYYDDIRILQNIQLETHRTKTTAVLEIPYIIRHVRFNRM